MYSPMYELLDYVDVKKVYLDNKYLLLFKPSGSHVREAMETRRRL